MEQIAFNKRRKLDSELILTIPVENHGEHPETGHDMITGYNLTFSKGTDKRKVQREVRKFMRAFGISDWRSACRGLGFTELV